MVSLLDANPRTINSIEQEQEKGIGGKKKRNICRRSGERSGRAREERARVGAERRATDNSFFDSENRGLRLDAD